MGNTLHHKNGATAETTCLPTYISTSRNNETSLSKFFSINVGAASSELPQDNNTSFSLAHNLEISNVCLLSKNRYAVVHRAQCNCSERNGEITRFPVILKSFCIGSETPPSFVNESLDRFTEQNELLKDLPRILSPLLIKMEPGFCPLLVRRGGATTLQDYCSSVVPPLESILPWVVFQMISCVAELHSTGIHHGNICLNNFLVSSFCSIILTDVESSLKPFTIPPNEFFRIGDACFDIQLIAPERLSAAQGSEELDPFAADIYSLGLCIIKLYKHGAPLSTSSLRVLRRSHHEVPAEHPDIGVIQHNPILYNLVKQMTYINFRNRPTAVSCFTLGKSDNLFPIHYSTHCLLMSDLVTNRFISVDLITFLVILYCRSLSINVGALSKPPTFSLFTIHLIIKEALDNYSKIENEEGNKEKLKCFTRLYFQLLSKLYRLSTSMKRECRECGLRSFDGIINSSGGSTFFAVVFNKWTSKELSKWDKIINSGDSVFYASSLLSSLLEGEGKNETTVLGKTVYVVIAQILTYLIELNTSNIELQSACFYLLECIVISGDKVDLGVVQRVFLPSLLHLLSRKPPLLSAPYALKSLVNILEQPLLESFAPSYILNCMMGSVIEALSSCEITEVRRTTGEILPRLFRIIATKSWNGLASKPVLHITKQLSSSSYPEIKIGLMNSASSICCLAPSERDKILHVLLSFMNAPEYLVRIACCDNITNVIVCDTKDDDETYSIIVPCIGGGLTDAEEMVIVSALRALVVMASRRLCLTQLREMISGVLPLAYHPNIVVSKYSREYIELLSRDDPLFNSALMLTYLVPFLSSNLLLLNPANYSIILPKGRLTRKEWHDILVSSPVEPNLLPLVNLWISCLRPSKALITKRQDMLDSELNVMMEKKKNIENYNLDLILLKSQSNSVLTPNLLVDALAALKDPKPELLPRSLSAATVDGKYMGSIFNHKGSKKVLLDINDTNLVTCGIRLDRAEMCVWEIERLVQDIPNSCQGIVKRMKLIPTALCSISSNIVALGTEGGTVGTIYLETFSVGGEWRGRRWAQCYPPCVIDIKRISEKIAVAAHLNGRISLIDFRTPWLSREFRLPHGIPQSVAVNPSGERLCVSTRNGYTIQYDFRTDLPMSVYSFTHKGVLTPIMTSDWRSNTEIAVALTSDDNDMLLCDTIRDEISWSFCTSSTQESVELIHPICLNKINDRPPKEDYSISPKISGNYITCLWHPLNSNVVYTGGGDRRIRCLNYVDIHSSVNVVAASDETVAYQSIYSNNNHFVERILPLQHPQLLRLSAIRELKEALGKSLMSRISSGDHPIFVSSSLSQDWNVSSTFCNDCPTTMVGKPGSSSTLLFVGCRDGVINCVG